MLSLDCVGEILAPLKSTQILTFISTWKRLESKCDAPPGPSGKNLKMDGQPLTEPTKQNIQHHSNTSVEKKKKKKKSHAFSTKPCNIQLGIYYLSILTIGCLGNSASSCLVIHTRT